MKDLIERLEKLDGPDRELGRQVLLACGWRKGSVGYFYGPMYRWSSPDGKLSFDEDRLPDPTESIDAAVSLVPEGFSVKLYVHPTIAHADVYLLGRYISTDTGGDREVVGGPHEAECASNPAIALTIAALKARSALSPVSKGDT